MAVDNDYAIWEAFDNHYGPALYFVDRGGHRVGLFVPRALLCRYCAFLGVGDAGPPLRNRAFGDDRFRRDRSLDAWAVHETR